MKKAIVLLKERLDVSERFRIELKVLQVEPTTKHPEGVKVSFALIDVKKGIPRLLIDNHAPFGFHVHTALPSQSNTRRALPTKDYLEALEEFWRLVKEILENEN